MLPPYINWKTTLLWVLVTLYVGLPETTGGKIGALAMTALVVFGVARAVHQYRNRGTPTPEQA